MAAKWTLFGTTQIQSGLWINEDINDTIDAMVTVVENGY